MNTLSSIFYRSISTATTTIRLGAGLLFLRFFGAFALLRTHGMPKLMDLDGTLQHIPDPLGLGPAFSTYYAIFANVICAVLVVFGLFTRWAALAILSITLSGLFIVHAGDPAKIQDTPLVYSILFGSIAILGPGRYSLDYLLTQKKIK
jgi:putative oxidoreductase